MGIKTVPQPPNSRDLALCDFWLFPKLRGCRYETIEEMKEVVTKVIDKRTSMGPSRSCWNGTNKCIAAGGDYFEEDESFMSLLSIKVPVRKKSLEIYLMIIVNASY